MVISPAAVQTKSVRIARERGEREQWHAREGRLAEERIAQGQQLGECRGQTKRKARGAHSAAAPKLLRRSGRAASAAHHVTDEQADTLDGGRE